MEISFLRLIGQMIEPHDIPAIPEYRESVVDHHLPIPRGASRVDAPSSSFCLQVDTVACWQLELCGTVTGFLLEKDRASWKAVESFSWSCDFHKHSFFAMCVELTRMTKLLHINYKINVTAGNGVSSRAYLYIQQFYLVVHFQRTLDARGFLREEP